MGWLSGLTQQEQSGFKQGCIKRTGYHSPKWQPVHSVKDERRKIYDIQHMVTLKLFCLTCEEFCDYMDAAWDSLALNHFVSFSL